MRHGCSDKNSTCSPLSPRSGFFLPIHTVVFEFPFIFSSKSGSKSSRNTLKLFQKVTLVNFPKVDFSKKSTSGSTQNFPKVENSTSRGRKKPAALEFRESVNRNNDKRCTVAEIPCFAQPCPRHRPGARMHPVLSQDL